ncbi:hypothetical protein JL722_12523 [Aureococcus anophagefferens]|nr:hypothetical protein JL722_12523 [Aureococcus anophagefferens]
MYGHALGYLRIAALGAPTATIWLVTNGIFRGLGDTATPLRWALAFTAMNAVFDPIFIFPSLRSYAKAGSLVLVRTLGKISAYSVCAREAAKLGAVASAAHIVCFTLGASASRAISASLAALTFANRRAVVAGLTTDPAVRAACLTVFPLVMACQALKGLAYPVNGCLMGALDWSAASATMWLSNGACALSLLRPTPTSLVKLWEGFACLFAVQCAGQRRVAERGLRGGSRATAGRRRAGPALQDGAPRPVVGRSRRELLSLRAAAATALLSFDLQADLTPAFHWNLKQLFVFVLAEYYTESNVLNQVILWDKIVTSEARLDERNVYVKYALIDQTNELRNTSVNYLLVWDHMPVTGRLFMERETGSTSMLPRVA